MSHTVIINGKPVLVAGQALREQSLKNLQASVAKLSKRVDNPFADNPELRKEKARLRAVEALNGY